VSRIVETLRGGDPRTLKGVTRAVDDVLHDPAMVEELLRALEHDDAVVRMRAADAAEKIGRVRPDLLQPYKALLLGAAASAQQPSLRWHLAQILPRLALDGAERRAAVAVLKRYLDDASAIVKTCAMQAPADLALEDRSLRRSVVPVLEKATANGTAAMRARGVRLLEMLELQPRARRRGAAEEGDS
jgi:HEAT repeat protein